MKIIQNILCIISAIILLWFGISFLDVVTDNGSPNPQHLSWNVFVLMTENL